MKQVVGRAVVYGTLMLGAAASAQPGSFGPVRGPGPSGWHGGGPPSGSGWSASGRGPFRGVPLFNTSGPILRQGAPVFVSTAPVAQPLAIAITLPSGGASGEAPACEPGPLVLHITPRRGRTPLVTREQLGGCDHAL